MKKIEIYDPAMCCSTGVCGPSVDKELLRIATVIDVLKSMGVTVVRHNLSSEPQAFIVNQLVNNILREEGANVLPIIILDGEVALKGCYPSTTQMSEWTGLDLSSVPVPNDHKGCGCGDKAECLCDDQAESATCCCGENNDECCCGKPDSDCCCAKQEDDCCCHKDENNCCCSEQEDDNCCCKDDNDCGCKDDNDCCCKNDDKCCCDNKDNDCCCEKKVEDCCCGKEDNHCCCDNKDKGCCC